MERIESIDAIRGIALFGVLMVNLVTEFRISLFEPFVPPASASVSAERVVARIIAVGLEQKAFCLFSLLFGVGLAIQYDRLYATGGPLYWLGRRVAVLLVLGLVHLLLIWNGDILTEYAIAGAVVLPLLLLPPVALLTAAAVFLFAYLIGSAIVYALPWPDPAQLRAHIAAAYQIYPTGSWLDVRRFSVDELRLIGPLHLWVFPRTVALFLFGAFLWRTGLFKRAHDYLDELALVGSLGIVAGAALTMADVHGWLALLAPLIFALGYAAALLALAQWPGGAKLLAPFALIGRMAFTHYLLQSVVFSLVFFGYGLGQFGRMSATMAFALGLAVYVAQIAASRWWLTRYRFGPVEWLWRTMMYGQAQPFRRRP